MSEPALHLTEPQVLMLIALRDVCDTPRHPGMPVWAREYATPRELAMIRWPDSPGWKKVSKRGSTPAGGALGATMPMKAATVLWRLAGHGLAQCDRYNEWTITTKGRNHLKEIAR